jgi:hypothetical protein
MCGASGGYTRSVNTRFRGFLDTYGLSHSLPLLYRLVVFWNVFAGIGFFVWWFAPHGPVLIAVLVVYVLVTVFGGLWWLVTSRELSDPPGRYPQRPPSTTPPSTS